MKNKYLIIIGAIIIIAIVVAIFFFNKIKNENKTNYQASKTETTKNVRK